MVYQPRYIEPSNTNMWTEIGRQATGFGTALRELDAEKRARQRQEELDARDQARYTTSLEMTPGVSRVAPGEASQGIQRGSLLPPPNLPRDNGPLAVPSPELPGAGKLSQAHLPGREGAIRTPSGTTSLSGAPGLVFDPQWRQKEEEAAYGRTQERETAERQRLADAFDRARAGGSIGRYIAEGGNPQDLVERPQTLDDQVAFQRRILELPRWQPPSTDPVESPERARMLRDARQMADTMADAINRTPEGTGQANPALALSANFPGLSPTEARSIMLEATDARRSTELAAQGAEALAGQRERSGQGGINSIIDRAMSGGMPTTAQPQVPLPERIRQLQGEGKSRDEARAILLEEGYEVQ